MTNQAGNERDVEITSVPPLAGFYSTMFSVYLLLNTVVYPAVVIQRSNLGFFSS